MPVRVLIVDDHILVREGTRTALEQCAEIAVVGEAGDGEEAVRAAVELRPDVILMDVAMPGMNGIEATRRIKALSPEIAILVLSGYDEDAYVYALLEAGAAGYLLKNLRGAELAEAIKLVHSGQSVLAPSVSRKVLERFIAPQGGPPQDGDGELLTEREKGVLTLAARGLTNKGIARESGLSPRTVQLHLTHIFDKLRVTSRTEAVMACVRRGWLRMEDLP